MGLASGFEARLHQMECTRNQRLQLLQAEKELQTKRISLLRLKTAELTRIQLRCFKLEQKSAELSCQMLALEDDIPNIKAREGRQLSKLRTLTREIYDLEQQRKQKDKFYDLKKQEMRKFEDELERHTSTLRSEVESLQNSVHEFESAVKVLQDSNKHACRKDGKTAFEEELGVELLAIKMELANKLASSYSTRSLLEQQLQSTLISQDEERDKLSHVMQRQKIDLEFLQKESQDFEEKVFAAMRNRDQRKKDLEDISNHISELRCLKNRCSQRDKELTFKSKIVIPP